MIELDLSNPPEKSIIELYMEFIKLLDIIYNNKESIKTLFVFDKVLYQLSELTAYMKDNSIDPKVELDILENGEVFYGE